MNIKNILGFSFALLAISSSANAITRVPTLTSDISGTSAPSLALDWNFLASSQTLSVTAGTNNTYTLTTTSTGTASFFNNSGSYNVNGSAFTLSATFNRAGVFQQGVAGSDFLSITGYFSAATAASLNNVAHLTTNAAPTTNSLLYDANLTAFGYGTAQGTLGFVTSFLSSWSDQVAFTGGSTGESAYLYSSTNSLAPVIAAFANGDLSSLAGHSYTGVSTIAAVPVPFSGLLFGTAIAAFMGSKRRALKIRTA